MSVSLQKGQKISLTKDNAGLARVIVGLGWDEAPRKRKGLFGPKPEPIDCDASAIMLQDGKLKYKNDVVQILDRNMSLGGNWHRFDERMIERAYQILDYFK